MDAIIAAAVTGLFALMGVMLTNAQANKRIENSLSTAQEVTKNDILHLTDEVKKLNESAGRIPVIETKVKDIDRRVGRLEDR